MRTQRRQRSLSRGRRARSEASDFAFFSCSGSASDPATGGRQKATDAFRDLPAVEAWGREIAPLLRG